MTQQANQFNPHDHLMQIKSSQGSKDYLPVQWRLVWFRSVCPEGTIDTEELEYDTEREVEAEISVWNADKRRSEKVLQKAKGYARYRAVVTDGKGGRATGTKSENAASFADYGEKAECVPFDTEILTRGGFKRYDELVIGEEVLAYDKDCDQCVWTPLQRVVVYNDASVVRLHGKWFDVYCTPEHTWPVYYEASHKGKKYEYRKLLPTSQLKTVQRLITSAPGPDGNHSLTASDAAILGWLITDGSIRREGNSLRSYICQSKIGNVAGIRELVGALAVETVSGSSTRTFPAGHTSYCLPQYRFTFSAAETRRLFDAAGIRDISDLPGMVTQYSQEARQAMLAAMMAADGDKRGYFGKKRKPGVMETWQILATLEGFSLSAMYSSTVGDVPLQRLKKRRTVCVSELQIEGAGRMHVWCPTTQYGTWVMRQNGRVMITGNTGAIGRALAGLGYGTQFASELDEEHRIVDAPVERERAPQSRQSGRDAEQSERKPDDALAVRLKATTARAREQGIDSNEKWQSMLRYLEIPKIKSEAEIALIESYLAQEPSAREQTSF